MSNSLQESLSLRVFEITFPSEVRDFVIIAKARDSYHIERGLLICMEALDASDESVAFSSPFCSYSESVNSWFTYYPANMDGSIMRLRPISVVKPILRLRIWLRNWNDKSTDVSGFLRDIHVISQVVGPNPHIISIQGE